MGAEEQAIGVAKRTFFKVMKEFPEYDIETIFQMVNHAMNSHVGSSGFSAFQWAHGQDHYQDSLPIGLNARKAFGGMLKAREKIRIEYEKELAREKFSKLGNAIGRPTQLFKTGQLVMLWRQKIRPGKTKGDWIGPLRLILVEGSTAWLASGANLIRAKLNQIRHVTRREEMTSVLEGAAVYRSPVTVETLLRNFKGRHYLDVSGDVPSEQRMQENLEPTEVLVPSQSEPRADGWVMREDENGRMLVRLHRLPRLNLFSPTATTACPVKLEEFTGRRVTIVRPLDGGSEVRIEDEIDVQRALSGRWIGETQFELRPQPPPIKVRRSIPSGSGRGAKRKSEDQPASEPDPPALEPRGEKRPLQQEEGIQGDPIPASSLNDIIAQGGLGRLDGVSTEPDRVQGAAGSNGCAVRDCQLPGGHYGPHEVDGRKFLYDPHEAKKMFIDEQAEREEPLEMDEQEENAEDESSSSSTTSEEMIPEEAPGELADDDDLLVEKETEIFYMKEFELTEDDFAWLAKNNNEKKANVWLSRKMMEKSKEVTWSKLPLEEKQKFDLAQAKELSQVATSQALRNLTAEEEAPWTSPRS